jgi:hypothetical protein
MRVFLSWSGQHSRQVATALYKWLPEVIQRIEPWMSSEDIQAGERWMNQLNSELEKTNSAVLCLTRGNLAAPWLLFEAGAAAKVVDRARVCPYLFGVPRVEVVGPLTQFQSVLADKEGTRSLVQSLNSAGRSAILTPDRLDVAFERCWPELQDSLASILDDSEPIPPPRSDRALIEELLDLVRAQSRVIDVGEHGVRINLRPGQKLDVRQVEEKLLRTEPGAAPDRRGT